MKIAFCITDLDAGGAERALLQLVTRLDRSRWEPHVYCLSGEGALVEPLQAANIPVTCFGAQKVRNLSVIFQLARELRVLRPALLQTYLFHANIAGRIAGRWAKVPVIVSGIRVAEKRSRVPLWIDRMTRGLVDHHVCVSQSVADFSRTASRLPDQKMSVIPNGVDVELYANAPPADLSGFGISENHKTALFVGRLDPQKNPSLVLEAMEYLKDRHPELHLLLVGDGPLRKHLESWVCEHHLTERIHFAGRREDVPELMKASDLFVLSSRWEGMPNVVLEAMAAGLPVVATRVEGTGELIQQNETGLLVSGPGSESISEAVHKLLSAPEEAREMGLRAQKHVLQDLTWDIVVEKYDALYRSLIED